MACKLACALKHVLPATVVDKVLRRKPTTKLTTDGMLMGDAMALPTGPVRVNFDTNTDTATLRYNGDIHFADLVRNTFYNGEVQTSAKFCMTPTQYWEFQHTTSVRYHTRYTFNAVANVKPLRNASQRFSRVVFTNPCDDFVFTMNGS